MFFEKLQAAADANNSHLCVGLDPDPQLMPHPHIPSFLQEIVDATSDLSAPTSRTLRSLRHWGWAGCRLCSNPCARFRSTSR